MTELKSASVVQIKSSDTLEKCIQGCVGYVVRPDQIENRTIVRLYQPKKITDWPEYSEYSIPNELLNYVGEVPDDMKPIFD